ncbi:hypothetical protein, partial [Streptomyces aculeolatus]|uniref:hypothetical protein n=1 Tax=Streptomyces aculeolatus TaxID=270689 RepID=UPI001CED0741
MPDAVSPPWVTGQPFGRRRGLGAHGRRRELGAHGRRRELDGPLGLDGRRGYREAGTSPPPAHSPPRAGTPQLRRV